MEKGQRWYRAPQPTSLRYVWFYGTLYVFFRQKHRRPRVHNPQESTRGICSRERFDPFQEKRR
jgi:hypothetical protein